MIPLRDNIPSRRFPVVNVSLIILNSLVFLFEVSLTKEQQMLFFYAFGMVPLRAFHPEAVPHPGVPFLLSLLTSLFIHGGWFHLIGNMLFLWIFGDNVEDRLGHLRYLIFYLLGGCIASLFQFLIHPLSKVPVVGASGAISAVMGAYFLLFPYARISSLLFYFFFLTIVEIPAFVYLGFWFLWQIMEGMLFLPFAGDVGGVAFWAHIGGFIFGMFFIRHFLPRRRSFYYF